MARLYTVMASLEDVAEHFGAEHGPIDYRPSDIIEGLPGLIVIERGGSGGSE